MRKLYENFHILYFQKRIDSTETIHGNTVYKFARWHVFMKEVGKSREKEGRSYFRSPQKYECHSHIARFDKKEWHSSFALNLGSGTLL